MESNFQIITADGSPSLQIGDECMHNLDGAVAETLHVYGPAIDYVLANRLAPHFTVVGMGLGYIEYLILAKCAAQNVVPQIESFESRDDLVENLKSALIEAGGIFSSAIDAVERSLNQSGLRSLALQALEQGRWRIRGSLSLMANHRASALLYDPFSKRTSPELWREDFLGSFLSNHASQSCVFATYASFGTLKSTLKAAAFSLIETKGFGKKRESTFAIRT